MPKLLCSAWGNIMKLAYERYRQWARRVRFGKKLSAAFLAAFWLYVFAVGSTLSSKPYRMWLNAADAMSSTDVSEADKAQRDRIYQLFERPRRPQDSESSEHAAELNVEIPELDAETKQIVLAILAEFRANKNPSSSIINEEKLDLVLAKLWSLKAVKYWAIVVFSFTPTNIALLCISAAMLGSIGRQLQRPKIKRIKRVPSGTPTTPEQTDTGEVEHVRQRQYDEIRFEQDRPNYASALVRGFFVFLFLLSGILVLTGSPTLTAAAGPDDYIRIAGLASVLGFLVGAQPEFMGAMFDRLGSYFSKGD